METTSERRRRANRGFTWVLFLSVALHAGAVAGVVFAQRLGRERPKVLTSIPVQLVRLGKKRDPKLLPRREEPRPAAAAPEAINLATNPSDAKSETTKKPQSLSKAAERLLAGSPGQDLDLDRAVRNLDEPEGDPQGDPLGTASEATNPASGYALEVSKVLKANYAVPELIPASQRRFLEAEVVLYVERDGTVTKFEFIRRHPNALFMSALEALLGRIKLPPPPANLARDMRETGLGVVFKP